MPNTQPKDTTEQRYAILHVEQVTSYDSLRLSALYSLYTAVGGRPATRNSNTRTVYKSVKTKKSINKHTKQIRDSLLEGFERLCEPKLAVAVDGRAIAAPAQGSRGR